MSYAEKVDMKQMAKKEAKKKTDSLQKILYKLRDNLNLQQRKELSDYAMKMFNEMVDRKVLRDNPKP
jgi:flagellin-specific chaperone FliS